jgi:hemerythrin-like metal-binding protein
MSSVFDHIEWTEQLVTGIPEIDRQHRFLINAINDAKHKLSEFPDLKLIEQITKDLLGYAIYHFETEEDLMLEHGYTEESKADADLHQRQHRDFSAQVMAVRDTLHAGNPVSVEELLGFLDDWLISHIMNTDQRLAAFIRQKQAA